MNAALILVGVSAARAAGPELYVQTIGGLTVRSIDEVDTTDLDTQLAVTTMGLRSPLPPVPIVKHRWTLLPLADFEYARLSFDGALQATVDGRDLFRPRLGLANLFGVTERIDIVAFVQLGLYTDFGGPLSGDDLGLSVIALGSWDVSDTWSLGAGAGYVWVFGRPRWTPTLEVVARYPRLEVDVFLPRTASVWWNPKGVLWLGGAAELDGGFYRIHADRSEALGQGALFQEYSRVDVGVGARVKLKDMLVFEVTGSVVPRTLATAWVDADTELFTMQLSPGWGVAGRVSLDLPGNAE